ILPWLETITRNGAGVCPRLIRAWRKSSETPSLTLSRLSVLCPIRTASASARCRNKCCLSSREVKSTGAKSRVVIFPSTVMAKVAETKGREVWEGPLRRNLDFPRPIRDAEVPPTFLSWLRDFMFRRGHFALHLAQLHPLHDTARFVEEVNNAAGEAAQNHDEKT